MYNNVYIIYNKTSATLSFVYLCLSVYLYAKYLEQRLSARVCLFIHFVP